MLSEVRTASGTTQLAGFFAAIREPLRRVEGEIRTLLASDDPLLSEVAMHLLSAGGKRLRPALVLLSAAAAGCGEDCPPDVYAVAAAVEIIHMATLVHDDMVDAAAVRRGVPTIHAKWGPGVSVLAGDFLFARGFSILSSQGDNRVVRIMSDVVHRMSAGEIRQLAERWYELDEAEYLCRVDAKTAYFIGESCRLGAVLACAPPPIEEALARFGALVGRSYQITDDILDLVGDPDELGKPSGSDLRAGVITLPVIYALDRAVERDELRRLIAQRQVGDREVAWVREVAERCGAIELAHRRAAALAQQAREVLDGVPPSPARQALADLAEYLVDRTF